MTNEQHKAPSIADSIARSFDRFEKRVSDTENHLNTWLIQLEVRVKSFIQSLTNRLDSEEEDEEDDE